MSDEQTVRAELAERIAKLEEQTLHLQLQVKRLQERGARRKKSKPGLWQSLSESHGELREMLGRTLIALGFFVFISMFVFVPSVELIEYVPGGAAVWGPVWWTAAFLMCAIGAVLFVTSRD